MANRTGFLTIFSADRTEIYGEFADADWSREHTQGGDNNIFTGTASEGTLETFLQLDNDAISHVAYTFESEGEAFTGIAELLAPIVNESPSQSQIRLETGEAPVPA